jgi:hypothetical protein
MLLAEKGSELVQVRTPETLRQPPDEISAAKQVLPHEIPPSGLKASQEAYQGHAE